MQTDKQMNIYTRQIKDIELLKFNGNFEFN